MFSCGAVVLYPLHFWLNVGISWYVSDGKHNFEFPIILKIKCTIHEKFWIFFGFLSCEKLVDVAFDVLYVGDTSVIHQSLKERHELLQKVVKPSKGRLETLVPDHGLNSHVRPQGKEHEMTDIPLPFNKGNASHCRPHYSL